MVIITDSTYPNGGSQKIHVRSRIFFNSDYLEVLPDDGDMIRIKYDDIKYIDSNNYQLIDKKD